MDNHINGTIYTYTIYAHLNAYMTYVSIAKNMIISVQPKISEWMSVSVWFVSDLRCQNECFVLPPLWHIVVVVDVKLLVEIAYKQRETCTSFTYIYLCMYSANLQVMCIFYSQMSKKNHPNLEYLTSSKEDKHRKVTLNVH